VLLKKMKRNIIGLVAATEDINTIINNNLETIHSFSKEFNKFYLFNFINLKIFKKKRHMIKLKYKLPENFEIKTFKNTKEVLSFFHDKKLISILHLGKSLEYFFIYYILKKIKAKTILVLNLGNYGNKTFIDLSFKYFFKKFYHYYDKGFYYIFRLLTIVNLFPKIDILFQSDLDLIKNIENGLSKRFDKLNKFFKVSYFKKIVKVNSKSFDYLIKNKIKNKKGSYILFIDTPIDHLDRTIREGSVSQNDKIEYYYRLNLFLKILSKLLKKKIIICPHPKMKNPKKFFQEFVVSKKRTIEMLPSAKLVLFTLSSAVLTSVLLKKKIFCLQSDLLGDYLIKLSNKYADSLVLNKINLDEKFSLKKNGIYTNTKKTIKSYDLFITKKLKVDGLMSSDKRVINTIRNNFY
tara:strand:+ start:1288 stop:2508 length:1221 start_codon:yes stop_codon:yes gene_type:complete